MSASKEPYGEMSLLDFPKYFPDEAHCWEYVVRLRWPKGKSCPGCHQAMGFVQTRRLFQLQSLPEANLGGFRNAVPSEPYSFAEVVLGDLSDGDHVQRGVDALSAETPRHQEL